MVPVGTFDKGIFVVVVVVVVVIIYLLLRSELIHKYLMLQQERDMLSRKCDQSKELIEDLYSSLEEFSELQESYSQLQESNLLQQEIVRHLQERSNRCEYALDLCCIV